MKIAPIIAIGLVVAILLGGSGCCVQEQETNSIKNNLKQINKGIGEFSKIKNGKLEVIYWMKSENNAVESMDLESSSKNTSMVTFILNHKGYDYIEETSNFNKKTGKFHYFATKQVQGKIFSTVPIEQSTKKRIKSYEWADSSSDNYNHYEPNASLKMMVAPAKWLSNEEYIESITKEKDGLLTKYTVTTNNAFAKYAKENYHSPEESYTVIEHREIYWVNKDGLLVKHQMYDEFEWTIDGIKDTYYADITVKLTGCNLKNLTEIK
ncbi:MAG: hypothetical protein AB9836_10205 [Aminipila sp.]